MTFSESGCKCIAHRPDLVYGCSATLSLCHNFEPPSIPFQIPGLANSLFLHFVVNSMSGELCITIQLFPSESYILINLVYPPTLPSKLSEAVRFWLCFWYPHFESRPPNRLSCGGYVIFLRISRKISTSYTKLRQYWLSSTLLLYYSLSSINSTPFLLSY
jgi:hypothetical protein